MTRPPRTLRAILKSRPAHGAMDFACYPVLYAVYLDADYGRAAVTPAGTLSFLAWVRLWLQLLWGQSSYEVTAEHVGYQAPNNRHRLRQRQRNAKSRRQGCALGSHIYRRKGLKACREWLYKYSLVWRLGWSFGRKIEGSAARGAIAKNTILSFPIMLCGAPLKPD